MPCVHVFNLAQNKTWLFIARGPSESLAGEMEDVLSLLI